VQLSENRFSKVLRNALQSNGQTPRVRFLMFAELHIDT
jgi:hypothetical protein